MFTATIFIIARTWKQPRCPSTYELVRKLWYIYTVEYYSVIKKVQMWVSWSEVDEPKASYSEWSKSEREKQVLYINTYMESRKMVLMNLVKNKLVDTVGEDEGRMDWESSTDMYMLSCVK